MFGEGVNMQGPRAPGQAAADRMRFRRARRLAERVSDGRAGNDNSGVGPALMRLLGAKTQYEQLSSGDYQPVFVGDDLYGSFGEGPFGGMVYTGRTLPPDVAAEYGIPGYDAPGSDDSEAVVAPVVDPVTNAKECPEGYIFDEDLQACRLDTSAPAAAQASHPGSHIWAAGTGARRASEFQRRYGIAPSTKWFAYMNGTRSGSDRTGPRGRALLRNELFIEAFEYLDEYSSRRGRLRRR